MIDIDPALRSTLGLHIGYEKDSMHTKLAGTLRQIWEPWRRHGSETSTQVSQFYIQLPTINRSMMRTASKFWLVACWLLVSTPLSKSQDLCFLGVAASTVDKYSATRLTSMGGRALCGCASIPGVCGIALLHTCGLNFHMLAYLWWHTGHCKDSIVVSPGTFTACSE